MATLSGPADSTTSPLLSQITKSSDTTSDDLRAIRAFLRLLCIKIDQSSGAGVTSWLLFFLLSVVVPAVSHFVLSYRTARKPYDLVVQLSLTAAAALSFTTTAFATRRSGGLRRLLFLSKDSDAGDERVRRRYSVELRRSVKLLAYFLIPCFLLDFAYKLWWYMEGIGKIPYIVNPLLSYGVCFVVEMVSWVYRTGNFLFVCVMFRVICHLILFRLREFAAVFEETAEVTSVLSEHIKVRRQLKVISHRFRVFILLGFVLVTVSQLASLLVTLRPTSQDDLFNTGEIPLSSIVLVSGLIICFRNAAKITHKAQQLTSHAAKWHVCATIDSFTVDPENGNNNAVQVDDDYDDEDEKDSDEDELEGTNIVYSHVNTINFQERQALVTYLENNRAAITMFGFTLDRTLLQAIFTLEMMMFLWVLNKTIGI